MNKLFIYVFCSVLILSSSKYYGSTLAPVVIAGSIIKSQAVEIIKKYNRKDCPVCKGKGWYMSGDGILKIDCTYCEEEKKETLSATPIERKTITSNPECINGQCSPRIIIKSYGTR